MKASPSSLRPLLRYVRPDAPRVTLAIACACAAAVAGAGYAYLIGPLLQAVLSGGEATLFGRPLPEGALGTTVPALLVALAAAKGLATFLHTGLMSGAAQRVMARLRRALYANVLALPPAVLQERRSADVLSRFTSDVAQVEFSVGQALTSYVKDTLQLLALLGVCFAIDPWLFFLAFVAMPAAALPVSAFARAVKKVATRSQQGLSELSALAAEHLHALPVVRAFRGEARALARFDGEQARYLEAMQRSLLLRGAFTPTLELLGIAGAALAIGYGAAQVSADPGLAGRLVSFLAAALLMYQPLKALSGTFSQFTAGLVSAARIFELTSAPPERDEGLSAAPLREGVRLRGLCVRLGEVEVLRGVDLELPRGKKVALVGPSGAGKSTVLQALLGFAPACGGELTWDGLAFGALRPRSLRAQLGWVAQDAPLFSGTVRENLQLAAPDATEDALWEALRRAHAEGFVRALPGGLHAEVGEKGARLSGGQRQRLAIARAFLRAPSLLLLDEPTSALDAESEREVGLGLSELMAGRTCLVVAHRLATVRDADLIYVLEAGRIVERGTHDELCARGGAYARLLRAGALQAA